MRISIPLDRWDPQRGGAEKYLARLARELQPRGHEVTVLCCQAVAGLEASRAPVVEVLGVPQFPRWRRELRFAHAAVERHRQSGRDLLWQVRHPLAADVYQPHGGSVVASRQAQGLALSSWRRLARDAFARLRPTYHVLRWLDRAAFDAPRSPLILAVSARVEDDFRRLYPDVSFRFERLPNPVDVAEFHDRDRAACRAAILSRYEFPENARIALFAAHHFRSKGLARIVAALPLANSWCLVVAGRDSALPFERQAVRLGVRNRLRFAGGVADLRTLYAGADAFVLPTYYDACSLSVLEALACGTPPITTRENGAAELLDHRRNGFILEQPDDATALANALGEIAGSPELGSACRARAEALSWEMHVTRLEKIMGQILDSKYTPHVQK